MFYASSLIMHDRERAELQLKKKNVVTFLNTNLGFDTRLGNWTRPQIDILVASCEV
jgi:hypothetical protein